MGTRPAKQPVIMAGRLLAMTAGSRLASEAELVKAGTPTNLVQADHPARRRLDDPLWRRANHQIALLEKLLQSPAGAVFSPSLNGATGTNVSINNFHRCFNLRHFHPGSTTTNNLPFWKTFEKSTFTFATANGGATRKAAEIQQNNICHQADCWHDKQIRRVCPTS